MGDGQTFVAQSRVAQPQAEGAPEGQEAQAQLLAGPVLPTQAG